ncbi:MAG: hypothetical protein JJE53_03340 [Candidatus Pacebacteria bacterium]|nr:hypothetical protein [Candidatus Paceibacterota bacterium]
MKKITKIRNLIKKKFLKTMPEFDKHLFVVELLDPSSKLEAYIAVHRIRGSKPSFGATRFLNYKFKKDALNDALRLSRLMSFKSIMAGLPYGGAKAVIIKPKGKFSRKKLLDSYTKGLNELAGKFVTGTDVGLNLEDIKEMKKNSKYLVGLKSNPEKYTAIGLGFSIQMISKKLFGSESFKNRTFAIQGIGKVGYEFLKIIYKDASAIYVADIDKNRLKFVLEKFPNLIIVDTNDIQKQVVDIYMPCALSHTLNKKTVKDLKCKIVIGSANNQLESEGIADLLHDKGIFYGPDYIVNSGGLISVVDEYEAHNFNASRIKKKVSKIKKIMNEVIAKSYRQKISPERIANKIAKKILDKIKK